MQVKILTGAADAYLKKYADKPDLWSGHAIDKEHHAKMLRAYEGKIVEAKEIDADEAKEAGRGGERFIEYQQFAHVSTIIDDDPTMVIRISTLTGDPITRFGHHVELAVKTIRPTKPQPAKNPLTTKQCFLYFVCLRVLINSK